MVKIHTIILFLILSSIPNFVFGQDQFYTGVGSAPTQEEAREKARADLARSIESFVSSRFEQKIIEEDLAITGEYLSSQIETYSAVVLKNVTFDAVEKKTGLLRKRVTWDVTARIRKRDVVSIFEERKENIRTMVREAIRAQQSGRITKALRNYYWAYILTYTYPDTLQVSLPPANRPGNARILISEKINDIFSGMQCRVNRSYYDNSDLIVNIGMSLNGVPVQDLQFSYYNGKEQDWCDLYDGSANVTLLGDFSSGRVIIRPTIEYEFKDEMAQARDVEQVYQFLSIPEFNNTFAIELDVSEHIRLDFRYEALEKVVRFYPEIMHLALHSVHWDFGDGGISSLSSPVHTYSADGNYQVTLQINNDPELRVRKHIRVGPEENLILEQDSQKTDAAATAAVLKHILDSKPDSMLPAGMADTLSSIVEIQETSPGEEAVEVPSGFTMTDNLPAIKFKNLYQAEILDDFMKIAEALNRKGMIIMGGARDFDNREGLHCFVFSKDSGRSLGRYLYRDGEYHTDLPDSISFTSLRTKFEGQAVMAVWVEQIQSARP